MGDDQATICLYSHEEKRKIPMILIFQGDQLFLLVHDTIVF
jgi:hypothetical protein